MATADASAGSGADAKRGSGPLLWAALIAAGLLLLGFGREHSAASARNALAAKPEAGRGRRASRPTQIPLRGWKDILIRVYHEIMDDRVVSIAGGVTFYTILAIFPAIAALVSLYGLFADSSTVAANLDSLSDILPQGAVEVIGTEMKRIAGQHNSTLSLTFVAGLAVSLWSANAGMKALFDALNIVYDEEEKRGFIKLNVISLGFTIGAILFLLTSIAGVIVLPIALDYIGLGGFTRQFFTIGRWPALLLMIAIALSLIYRYGPSRSAAKWRWITLGSAFAAIAWVGASLLFSWYASNFANFNKTYGSLGTIIGFMLWIWVSSIVILVGAELDAEMEHQTTRDTTTGAPKPMGQRGAVVADSVGVAQT